MWGGNYTCVKPLAVNMKDFSSGKKMTWDEGLTKL